MGIETRHRTHVHSDTKEGKEDKTEKIKDARDPTDLPASCVPAEVAESCGEPVVDVVQCELLVGSLQNCLEMSGYVTTSQDCRGRSLG